jgi:hypothetical protein
MGLIDTFNRRPLEEVWLQPPRQKGLPVRCGTCFPAPGPARGPARHRRVQGLLLGRVEFAAAQLVPLGVQPDTQIVLRLRVRALMAGPVLASRPVRGQISQPLPPAPAGDLLLVAQWTDMGMGESSIVLSGGQLRDAAAGAQKYWQEDRQR